MREWRQEDPSQKTLIFCFFRDMLDLAEVTLRRKGYKVVQYTGGMSPRERDEAIALFGSKSLNAPTVMLLSSSIGGGESEFCWRS